MTYNLHDGHSHRCISLFGLLVDSDAKGDGIPVALTLMTSALTGRVIYPDPEMLKRNRWRSFSMIRDEFEATVQSAFQVWRAYSSVSWMVVRCDGGCLGELDGPSMGAAFAVGLCLLQSGGSAYERAATMSLPQVVISAALGKEARKCQQDAVDDFSLSRVGDLGSKIAGLQRHGELKEVRVLAVSADQKDVGANEIMALRAAGIALVEARTLNGLVQADGLLGINGQIATDGLVPQLALRQSGAMYDICLRDL